MPSPERLMQLTEFARVHGFPNPATAPDDTPLAYGGDLSPRQLLAAYYCGIFPWYSEGSPILWWSPDPRFVLLPQWFRYPRSLKSALRDPGLRVSFDQAFAEVIQGCSEVQRPGQEGTWLVGAMIDAYCSLHQLGWARSVEVWDVDGQLVGGLYGVQIKGVFFGESMFYRQANASKVALVYLVERLLDEGCQLIDCQQPTEHMARFGARSVERSSFLLWLQRLLFDQT